MTREEKIKMYEQKKSFVFCLGCLYAAEPSIDVKRMEYGWDVDTCEEKVRIYFEGGAIREISVNGDSAIGIQKDILKVLD